MSSVRRHLASLGLAVAACHLVMQVLVSAALCCQSSSAQKGAAVQDCCPAGSHPPGLCPLHAANKSKSDSGACKAGPLVNLHDLVVVVNSGGPVPVPAAVAQPTGTQPVAALGEPSAIDIPAAPPGPPPRA